ncbi:MAG: glycosyltransferase family 39 protein, partial [Planctomycetes bacterium]|nr:glycosyltransferase family 39 protein [Planctomycetota bacterium]
MPAPPPAGRRRPWTRALENAWVLAFLLLALTLALRTASALRAASISSDGPEYVELAKLHHLGQHAAALRHPYHPAYPWLISFAYLLLPDWEAAARLVSILLASFAALPIFFTAERVFGRREAVLATLLYAVSPHAVRQSATVLTTGTYLFFAACTVFWAVEAVRARRWGAGALAGAAAAGGYLTRPDGLLLAAVGGLWLLAGAWRSEDGRLRAGGRAALFTLTFLAAVAPYLLFLREFTGRWSLSAKFDSAMASVDVTSPLPPVTPGGSPAGDPPRPPKP